jgi:phosphoglycolate phosphatase
MVKLVVFDLDGTLADTLADLAASVNQALAKRGLTTYPDEAYKHFVGNGVDNLIRQTLADHYTPALAAEVKADFSAYYAGHSMDYTAVYPGIAALLQRLSDSGIMTAVISNKPDAFVPHILGTLYPDHRFSYLSGQKPDIPRKPDPASLLIYLESVGVSKEDTLYVGDSDVDVRYAHAAGVRVCGVSWGFRGADELRAAGADRIADTADELAEVIYE